MKTKRLALTLLGITSLYLTSLVGADRADAGAVNRGGNRRVSRLATPEDYNAVVMAIGNGTATSFDEFADTDPEEFAQCQRDVFERSPADIEAHRAAAIEFFEERFGVVADDPDDGFLFDQVIATPQNNYRVYAISGEPVPSDGYLLRDCAYRITVTNPNGATLGGEFAGVQVPPGTFMVFGDYAINREFSSGRSRTIHTIAFQSASPLIPGFDGSAGFKCELFHPDWGSGLGEGFLAVAVDAETGELRANIRHIMTFSDAPLNGL